MALKTRVWSVGKVLALVAALAATYVLFAAASMRLALQAREVTVPDLTNRTTMEATAVTAGLGLTLKVDDARRQDARVGAGRVVAQDPAAGVVARRPRGVKVWLSAGPRPSVLPSLVGGTERTAQLRLAQSGFALRGVSEIRSADYAPDTVVAQEPPGETPGGDNVSLLVNRGTQGVTYVMPDLIGVSGDRAAEILRQHDFRVAVVGSIPYPGVPTGIVLRQGPQAGFRIGPGEAVSLEVSR